MTPTIPTLIALLGDVQGGRLTAAKTAAMITDGFQLSGFVTMDAAGNRAIVELAAVRRLTNAEAWKLMHPGSKADRLADVSTYDLVAELEARLKKARPATLAREVKGKFSTWPAGTRVSATLNGDGTANIRRDPYEGALTVANAMVGIPADALTLDEIPDTSAE